MPTQSATVPAPQQAAGALSGPPAAGYMVAIDSRVYEAHKDGRPFTLADAWRGTYGVARAAIYRPDGSLLLANAGSVSTRDALIRRAREDRLYRRAVAAIDAAFGEADAALFGACYPEHAVA